MKKKTLAILIALLGVACLVCGILLFIHQPKPAVMEPTPSVAPTASPTAEPTEEPQSSQPEVTEERQHPNQKDELEELLEDGDLPFTQPYEAPPPPMDEDAPVMSM